MQEMMTDGQTKSKTLLQKHKAQFDTDTSREDLIKKRQNKKKYNVSKLNQNIGNKIKKYK